MVSVTTSSSASWSATSIATRARGITPTVRPPPARTARATAPIIETEPPPDTYLLDASLERHRRHVVAFVYNDESVTA